MIAYFNSHEFKEFYRLATRGLLLILPFVILQFLEIFVLPIDFFTFRIWEAALATPYRYPGAYYPNLHVKKEKEYGDRLRGGVTESKSVEWFTDSYGWRNRPEIEKRGQYDAIVIGDSNIVGSFLDQKNIISEVLIARSNKTVYSYSYGHDGTSLFFSDPRPTLKSASLLVVESKGGNWTTNNSYLANFRETSGGSLDVRDKTQEFLTTYYSSTRKPFKEKIESRVTKQALWHLLKANFLIDFVASEKSNDEIFIGKAPSKHIEETAWRPVHWRVEGEKFNPLSVKHHAALTIRALESNSYLHTERFVSSRADGKLILRFDAKNSIMSSKHRVWIFEDGYFRSVGEIITEKNWLTFELPIMTQPGSILELQIDQPNNWQWLSLRDIRIIGAKQLPAALTQKKSKDNSAMALQEDTGISSKPTTNSHSLTFPKPSNLTPLDDSGHALTIAESQYYFYHAVKAIQRRADERQMKFICFVMPDEHIFPLLPVIHQLRREGVKVIAYEPENSMPTGVEKDWYWQKADSHWTEAAVRLTADEILRMWKTNTVENRPFSEALMADYTNGFPDNLSHHTNMNNLKHTRNV